MSGSEKSGSKLGIGTKMQDLRFPNALPIKDGPAGIWKIFDMCAIHNIYMILLARH